MRNDGIETVKLFNFAQTVGSILFNLNDTGVNVPPHYPLTSGLWPRRGTAGVFFGTAYEPEPMPDSIARKCFARLGPRPLRGRIGDRRGANGLGALIMSFTVYTE